MTFNVNAQVRLLPPTNVAQIAAQLRAQLSNVTANVNVNVSSRAQRNINNMNSSIKKTKAGAKEAASAMSDFGKQAALAGKRFFAFTVATSGILAFVSSLREGTKEAIAFQRELVKISQVTGTATRGLSDLTNEIARLSTTLGVDSNQLLKASRILAQTGLTAKQTEQALQALAKSDLAPTFDDIISTTEGSIAIFRQFGVEADQLESKLGSINAVAGKFAVESSDIIAAVRRTGGAFSAAGGNLEELIALFTSVRATTRESAESIATGFRTIFTRLQRVRTQNFLENLGIELRDADNQFVGPLQAIQRLSIALKDLRGTDPRFAQIIEELGGFRQVSKVIPLIQQFATAEKALGVAVAGTTSLTRDSETAQEALAVQIAKTREKFAEMIRTFTNSDTFQGTIKIMLKLADSLIKVAEALEPLLPMIGLLGSITVGRLGVSAFREFRQAGGFGLTGLTGRNKGGVFEFASGGLVPGVGNRDTVPAKLTPGEYVLRKSAVQRIGEENLQHLNAGGPAYGGVYLLGDIRAKKNKGKTSAQRGIQGNKFQADLIGALNNRGISLEEYDLLYDKKPIAQWGAWGSSDIAVEERVGALSHEYKSDFAKNVRRRVGQVMVDAARDITKGEAKINNSSYIPELEAVQGIVFEGAMARMGAPFDDDVPDDKRPMDFPNGLPTSLAQSIQGHGGLMNIPVDAKRQENSKARKSIKDKYTRELADRLKAGETFQRISIKKKQIQKAATGGSAYLPNAILTPGEFVVSKEDAARIGEDRLDYINRTGNIPGMATGGSYGRMFKPKLTGRAISPGNVGRKKQYIDQLLEYLEKGMAQGLLGVSEKKMLRELRARKTHIKDDRSRRFNKRFSLMNKGGAYGSIRRYATGGSTLGRTPGGTGPVLGNVGNIALLISGASALAGTIDSVNESLGDMITWITTLGSQFAILFTGLRTAQNFVGRFDKKIDASFTAGRTITSDVRTLRDRTNLIRSSQQNGAVLTPAARQELREKDAQLVVARSARRQQIKNIRTQRRLQTASTYAAGALAAFGAALTAWGSYLETKGREDIEKGLGSERLVAGRRASTASSFGQTGALTGAAIGAFTPLTPAGGAILGGLIGGFAGLVRGDITGRKEAFDLTQLRDFNQALKLTTFRLEGLAEGTTNVGAQAQEVANFVASTRNRLISGVGTDTRRDILDSARQQVQGFNNVISQLVQTDRVANADNVEAGFQEILHSLGQDTVEFIARLTDVPYGQFNERIKRNIESIQSATKTQKELSAVQDRYTQQLRNIVNVGRVFNDVSVTMQKFDSVVGTSLDSLVAFDESARLADPAKFFDEAATNRLISRDITNNPFLQSTVPGTVGGTIGQQLGQDVTAASEASRELPAILLRIRNSLSDFGGEDALTKLEAEFSDYPQFVRDAIIKAARGIIGEEGKQEKLVEAAQKDFTGTLQTLAAGLDPLNEVSAQLVKSMNEEANRRIASIQSIIQFTDALTDARNRSLGVADEAERIRSQTRNRPTNLSLLQANDDQRLQNILAPIGGGNATARRVIDAQIKLQELKNKRDREGIDVNANLTKQIQTQAFVIQRTTQALEFLANVGERSAVTMEEFERAQKAVEFKTSLVDRGLGIETPEQSRQFALELRAARTAAQSNTLDVIPPQFRSEVLSLLEGLGPGELDVLGGRSGDDVIKEFRRSFLNRIAATPGGPTLSDADIDKLVEGQSTESERLAGEIDKIIEESKRASAELERIASENLGNVADKFDASVTKFTNSIATLINAQNVDKVARDLAEASGNQDKLRGSLRAAQRFNAAFGQSPIGRDEERARAIGKNLDLIKTVFDQRQQQQILKDFVESERASRDQIRSSLEGFGGYIPFVDDVKVSDQAQLTDIGGGVRSLLPYLNAKFGEQKRITSEQADTGIEYQLNRVTRLTGGNQQAIDAFRAAIDQQRDENLKFEGGAGGTISARKFAAAITIALEKASNAAANQYGALSDAEINLVSKELNLTATEIRLVGEQYDKIKKQWEAFAQSTSINDLQIQLGELTEKIKTYNKQLTDLGVGVPVGSQRGGIIGFNKGGVVPGVGNRDSVLGALTPGEIVLPKQVGGFIFGSSRKRLEDLTADERKFRVAHEARRAEQQKRLAKLGRSPRTRTELSEHEKAQNAFRAKAFAKNMTTQQLYNYQIRAFGNSLGSGIGNIVSSVTPAIKKGIANKFNSSLFGQGINALRKRLTAKTESELIAPISEVKPATPPSVESKQQRELREANERINKYNKDYKEANRKVAHKSADDARKAKLLDDIRFRMLDPSRLSEYVDVFDNKTLLNMDKSTLEAARARLSKKIAATAQRLRVNRSTAGARIGGGDTIGISGAERQLHQERVKRYDEVQLALKFQEGLEAERERNTKYRTDTEAPNTIGGVIKELHEVYKIGKRGANYISSNNPDYALGLGNVSEFVGTGEIVGGAFGLGSKLLTISRGTKTTQAAATSVNRAQQASQAAERTREAAATATRTEATRKAVEATAKAERARKTAEATQRAEKAREAAAAAAKAEEARKAATATATAEKARKGAAAAKAAQAGQTAVKVSKLTPNAAKRLMDSIKLGAKAGGTAEGQIAQQVAKSLGVKYGVTAEHLTQFGKIADQATNVRKATAAERELMRLINLINKANGFQRGSYIPGIGSGDKVHAMLEPGEYVLNRNAVSAVGKTTLDRVNSKYSRFQNGGQVGLQEGGGVAQMAMPDFTFFNEIVQKFGNKVDLLAESVNNINGMEIQLVASHRVEVIINGAQVLQQLQPSIQNMIVNETNKAINSMLKIKFPEVGIMN